VPAALPTPRGRAINFAPVHRFSADRKCFVATAATKRPETPPSLSVYRQIPRRRFRCIAIHQLKSYQRSFGRFWQGKPGISSSSGEKRAEGVWGGAVNGCYGKCNITILARLEGAVSDSVKVLGLSHYFLLYEAF